MGEPAEEARRLISELQRARSLQERQRVLARLGDDYEALERTDDSAARDVRVAYARALRDDPEVATDEHLVRFLHAHITPEDFAALPWDDADQVIALCELLYSVQHDSPDSAERIEFLVGQLLRQVLQKYERERRHESMFRLVRFAPSLTTFTDAELFRLRHRAYLYEMRRVRRNRGVLYGYLVLQAVLVLVVFPTLFVYSENGAIQRKLSVVAGSTPPREAYREYSYEDALYWSLITAGTVGYGDVTPTTRLGRALAAVLGLMGVLTSGVVAGLVLKWIAPRQLDG
jgi:hypothetical protein